MPSAIEFVTINCQIRLRFCQFGCEVIVVPCESEGRTIRRHHAYTLPPCIQATNRGAVSPAPLYRAYWIMRVHSVVCAVSH